MSLVRNIRVFALVSMAQAMLLAQSDTTELTPVSNAVNSELPSWMRFSGEDRVRMENLNGEGFKPIGDLYLLQRLRLSMNLIFKSWFTFYFQAEDSRVFGQNTLPAPATQKDAMDLRVGYVQVGAGEGPVTLRAGRQSLDFGDGRLLADSAWSNVGRTFDSARVTLRDGPWKADLFSGASVKINQTNFDLPTPGEHFDGAYGSTGALTNTAIEPYFFWRGEHDYKNAEGKIGNLDEKTVGFRWAGKLPYGLDYTTEIAGQVGSYAGDQIRAWMGHWVAGETLPDSRHRPRIYVEYNRATGNGNPKGDVHSTFDPLFASTHNKYGLTDLFGSSNIVHTRGGFEYMLLPKLKAGVAYNDFWLENSHDGLYVSNKIVAQSIKGTAGTHIGQEFDAQTQWAATRVTTVNIGLGRLLPGEFLHQTTSGATYNIVFAAVTQRF